LTTQGADDYDNDSGDKTDNQAILNRGGAFFIFQKCNEFVHHVSAPVSDLRVLSTRSQYLRATDFCQSNSGLCVLPLIGFAKT